MGASRDFDGTDDYVDVGDPTSVDFGTGDYSFSAWIRPETISDAKRMMIIAKDASTGRQFTWEVNGRAQASTRGSIRQAIFDSGGSFTAYDSAQDTIVVNQWVHLAVTKSGNSPGAFKLYKNGVEVSISLSGDSPGDFPRTMNASSTALRIGNRVYIGFTDEFDGQIAYVSIYNRALSSVEIVQLFRNPGSIPNGLIHYWPLWGANSPEPDLSGNGNNGTVTGAVESFNSPPVAGIWLPHRSRSYHFSQAVSPAPIIVPPARRKLRSLVGVGL